MAKHCASAGYRFSIAAFATLSMTISAFHNHIKEPATYIDFTYDLILANDFTLCTTEIGSTNYLKVQ